MKTKAWIYEGLRWIAVIAVVVYLVVLFGGNGVSQAEFTDVCAAVMEVVDTTNMQEAENPMVKRLYGLEPGSFEGCSLYYPTTNMGAEEVLILKLADTSQQEAVLAAAEQRLQTQRNTFEGYGVEQFDLLTNHYVLQVQGNFVLFAVGEFSGDALSAFRDAL